MWKHTNVRKQSQWATWTCSSVLYLLLSAVYLNQVSSLTSTFSSALTPGFFIGGEIIVLSSMLLPAFFTFWTSPIFEEITAKTSVRCNRSLFIFLWFGGSRNVKVKEFETIRERQQLSTSQVLYATNLTYCIYQPITASLIIIRGWLIWLNLLIFPSGGLGHIFCTVLHDFTSCCLSVMKEDKKISLQREQNFFSQLSRNIKKDN